jgi:AraC family transcriptional regulator of arabinose operon
MSHRNSVSEDFIWQEDLYDPRVSEVVRLLNKQPQLRATQLARAVGLSTSRLHHLFKEQMGSSIGAYAKTIQLNLAADLLIETHLSLKEIRNEVGISDSANFLRYFKKSFGMSPSGYRRLKRAAGFTYKKQE